METATALTTTRLPPEPPQLAARLRGALLSAAATVFLFMLGLGLQRHEPSEELATARPCPPHQEMEHGGSSGIAEAAVEGPGDPIPKPSSAEPIARELPPKPFLGQDVPDSKGRCRKGSAVPINGGCWLPIDTDLESCRKDSLFEHKGECYIPLLETPRIPVSSDATAEARF